MNLLFNIRGVCAVTSELVLLTLTSPSPLLPLPPGFQENAGAVVSVRTLV